MPNTGSLEREEMISSKNPISTQDLISWSFQIANGMNHLANKKVFYTFIVHHIAYWRYDYINLTFYIHIIGNSWRFGGS